VFARAPVVYCLGVKRSIVRRASRVLRRGARYALLAVRFARLYWRYLAAVLAGASLAWLAANAASDYTRGGWEFHLEQRAWGLDLHFHHWYYGVPLLAVAVALLDTRPVLAVFLFVFGQALSAHSYQNEGGIPSIFQGGATLVVPAFLYWPVASLLAALFTFFVVRSHEWLAIQASTEEASQTYRAGPEACDAALAALAEWARGEFERETSTAAPDGARSASFSRIELGMRGLWELHCAALPVGDGTFLLTVRVRHMSRANRTRRLLEFLTRADERVRPFAEPVFSPAAASRE
jgi:hypothetical protein